MIAAIAQLNYGTQNVGSVEKSVAQECIMPQFSKGRGA